MCRLSRLHCRNGIHTIYAYTLFKNLLSHTTFRIVATQTTCSDSIDDGVIKFAKLSVLHPDLLPRWRYSIL